jgi:hypothetical protein
MNRLLKTLDQSAAVRTKQSALSSLTFDAVCECASLAFGYLELEVDLGQSRPAKPHGLAGLI